jgi:hypothetical protein
MEGMAELELVTPTRDSCSIEENEELIMAVVDDKVTPLPTVLERVGRRIDAAWQRVGKGEAEWVEGSLEAMQALAEARGRFPADQAFGVWLKVSNHNHWNENDRGALINMASDLVLARQVLASTERRSYQLIWKDAKSRFPNARKPRRTKPAIVREPPSANQPSWVPETICEQYEKLALDIHAKGITRCSARDLLHHIRWQHFERSDARFKFNNNWTSALARWLMHKHSKLAGFFALRGDAEEDENKSGTDLPDEREIGRREMLAELLGENALVHFTKSGKLRVDDAIRIHTARINKSFDQRVNAEVRRQIDIADDHTREQNKQLRMENLKYQSIMGDFAVFTKTQYRQMIMLCHPDNSAGPELKAQLLQVLLDNERRLVKPEKGVK